MSSINITIHNSVFFNIEDSGGESWNTGTGRFEFETNLDFSGQFYIHKKGYGSSSAKRVSMKLNNEQIAELISILNEHIRLTNISMEIHSLLTVQK